MTFITMVSEHFKATCLSAWIQEFRDILKTEMVPEHRFTDKQLINALVTIFPKHAAYINEYQKDKGDTLYDLLREQEQLSHALLLDFPFLVEG